MTIFEVCLKSDKYRGFAVSPAETELLVVAVREAAATLKAILDGDIPNGFALAWLQENGFSPAPLASRQRVRGGAMRYARKELDDAANL